MRVRRARLAAVNAWLDFSALPVQSTEMAVECGMREVCFRFAALCDDFRPDIYIDQRICLFLFSWRKFLQVHK
jgi:hypothetical protein